MNDRELLEKAAKTADLPECGWMGPAFMYVQDGTFTDWNPLIDDGDAFRLAAKLGFNLKFGKSGEASLHKDGDWYGTAIGPRCSDPAASMRRAIVRLAASRQDANEVHELVYKKSED